MLYLYLAYIDSEEDKLLFEKIFNDHKGKMFSLAKSVLHNDFDAEDCVSSVFLKVASQYWSSILRIENDEDIRNYLLKATKNTALNLKRSEKKEVLSFQEPLLDPDDPQLTDDAFFNQIVDKMEYEIAIQGLQSMDPKYRDALYFHLVVGLSVQETAKILEQSMSATKQQLVRGKKMLLDLLNNEGDVR